MKNYKSKLPVLRLVKEPTDYYSSKVITSHDASIVARNIWNDDIGIYESFYAIYLNCANRTIGVSKISQGGVSGTVVDVRLVLKYGISVLASSIILVHNHPSGNLQPSKTDIDLTKKCVEAAKIMDMCVVDHIILTEESHISMADEGLI